MSTITQRILYVSGTSTGGSMSTLLNSASEKSILKQWCNAKGITGIKWYCSGQNTANRALLRALISDMRANTTVQNHQWVLSGQVWDFGVPPAQVGTPPTGTPPGVQVNSFNSVAQQLTAVPYGSSAITLSDTLAANQTEKFFNTLEGIVNGSGCDLERESYNFPDTTWATDPRRISDYNSQWKPVCVRNAWGLQYSPLGNDFSRKDGASTAYLGWFNPASCDYANTIAATLTRIDLHAYRVTASSMFGYVRSRLEQVATAWAAYRLNPTALVGLYPTGIPQNVIWESIQTLYPWLPIFSLENAFMGPLCSTTGGNKTFDECFEMFMTGSYAGTSTPGAPCFNHWKAGTLPYNAPVFPNRNVVKTPEGYVLFMYEQAFAARPSLVNP